jgi:hypothetical protein
MKSPIRKALMRIRILQSPPINSIDGIRLDCYEPGSEYQVGNSIGALFLAEGWAEPVPLDVPAPILPFSDDDPYEPRLLDKMNPPNLVRDTYPPYLDRFSAAPDLERRKRRR